MQYRFAVTFGTLSIVHRYPWYSVGPTHYSVPCVTIVYAQVKRIVSKSKHWIRMYGYTITKFVRKKKRQRKTERKTEKRKPERERETHTEKVRQT